MAFSAKKTFPRPGFLKYRPGSDTADAPSAHPPFSPRVPGEKINFGTFFSLYHKSVTQTSQIPAGEKIFFGLFQKPCIRAYH
jgi:hypothetical protein